MRSTIAGRRRSELNPITLIAVLLHTAALSQNTLLQASQQAPQGRRASWEIGKATYYHRGTMERVASYRGLTLEGTTGFSTYPDCEQIGNVLVVSVFNPVDQEWSMWERKRIVDCSQPEDYARHKREGLVELSYEDAGKYGYRGEGRTRIRYYLERRK